MKKAPIAIPITIRTSNFTTDETFTGPNLAGNIHDGQYVAVSSTTSLSSTRLSSISISTSFVFSCGPLFVF